MSDDLSPAEQVRAARWAREWLHERRFNEARVAMDQHIDILDPPETVESLRAERDEALADVARYKEQFRLVCDESKSLAVALDAMRDEQDEALAEMEEVGSAWRQEQIMHQKAWATICNLQAELAATLRDNERFEGEQEELVQALNKLSAANYTIARLRATHGDAEAAGERCEQQPRMWYEGDSEPEGVQQYVADGEGDLVLDWAESLTGMVAT